MANKKLTIEEVEHVARLARIELSEAEKKKFQTQLTEILAYVDVINEVDTSGVEPTWQVTGLKNVIREDRVVDYGRSEELIEAAPESEEGQVRVKKIL